MDFLTNLAYLIVLGGGAFGVVSLAQSKKYQSAFGWYKNLIAFVVGSLVAILSTPLVQYLYRFSTAFYGYNGGILDLIWSFASHSISIVASLYLGVLAYFYLCNGTPKSVYIGYVFYGIWASVCVVNVYHHFVYYDDVLNGGLWIFAIAVGLFGTITIPGKIVERSQETEAAPHKQGGFSYLDRILA